MRAHRITANSMLRHYEVIRLLGRGGMGEVYLARDTRLGRLVAIKLLTRRGEEHPDHIERFFVEARATAQLAHENIVVIFELGEHESMPFMVLEYLKGKTFQDMLQELRDAAYDDPLGDPFADEIEEGEPREPKPLGLSKERAVELILPVVRALACAHERGIVHRDLKPSNIMLTDTGTVKVLDFGLAKLTDDFERSASESVPPEPAPGVVAAEGPIVTETGRMLGTKPYMSPEQWCLQPVDHRSDIWSVGIILAELLLGHHPLAPLSLYEMASIARLNVPMPSLRKLLPEVGKLGSIVDRCLIKQASDRMGSARELLAELSALSPDTQAGAVETTSKEAHSPYPGLASFQVGDARRFFGRTEAALQVVTQLAEQPTLVIVGPSGAGKSSFVRAGVIPALSHSNDSWEAFVLRPGSKPLSALSRFLIEDGFHSVSLRPPPARGFSHGEDGERLAEQLRTEPGLVGAKMRGHARSKRKRLLLFIDQSEELYTLSSERDRAAFFACLSGIADDVGSPLRVVMAIRSDFLDNMADTQAMSSTLRRGIVLLPAMDREGLREALVRPLDAVGYRFESPQLVEEMLDALQHTTAALPLLSFTASRLWAQRDRDKKILTESSYRKMGGIGGALGGHADAVLGALSQSERTLARAALLRLVTPERTRAVCPIRELCEIGSEPKEMKRVLAHLTDARLLTVEGGESEATVELVHESLIKGWPTLSEWLANSQADAVFLERLRRAAREWEGGGSSEDLLWRGQVAEAAKQWHSEYSGHLAPSEERYLEAVIALSNRSRQARRVIAASVIAALSVIAVTVSILAIRAGRSAEQAHNALADTLEAERKTREKAIEADKARLLAGFRELKSKGQLAWGTKLLAAVPEPEDARGWIALASDAVASPMLFATLRGHERSVLSAEWSHDGKLVVTASADRTARIFASDGSGIPILLRGHSAPITLAVFSPSDDRVLTASHDGNAGIWSADGSGSPVVLGRHPGPVLSAAWSPDGKSVVTVTTDAVARVWSSDGRRKVELKGHEKPLTMAAFLPGGERVLTASHDGTARIFRADGQGEQVVFKGHQGEVIAAAPSPDGSRIVTASTDRTARVWDTSGKGDAIVLSGHTGNVVQAAFSPDGMRVVTCSNDKTARIWDASGEGDPVLLSGHTRSIVHAAFDPTGRYVATASRDKTVRIWPSSGGSSVVLTGNDAPVESVRWSPDGKSLLTAAPDEANLAVEPRARIWSAGHLDSLPRRGEGFFHSAAFGPDAKTVASAYDDQTARLVRLDKQSPPLVLGGHLAWVSWAAPSPDGKKVVTTSFDGLVRVHFVDQKREPILFAGHIAAVRAAFWSPDGARIVTVSDDETARVLSVRRDSPPRVLKGHKDALTFAAWSPDGARIVTTSLDHTARVFKVGPTNRDAPESDVLILGGHGGGVLSAAWSPDGMRIVTGSEDGVARMWSAGDGAPLFQLDHGSPVLQVVFDPAGKRIATSVEKGQIRVSHADGTGEPIVLDLPAPALSMTFVDKGDRLLCVLSDGTTRSFLLSPEALTAALTSANTDCLPPDLRSIHFGEPPQKALSSYDACEREHGREQSPVETVALPLLSPGEKRVTLFVLPGDASVEVDGRLAVRRNGAIDLVGKVGEQRTVRVFKGAQSTEETAVTILAAGASPSRIDLNGSEQKPKAGPSARGPVRFIFDD